MTALLELVLWSNSKDLPHLLAKRLAPTLHCVTLSSKSCYTVCFKIIILECREIVDKGGIRPEPLPQFSAVSLPLLVSSEIMLLTKILALHYAILGENRYLAVGRVGHLVAP